ncbi:MAG: family N-acetyltransferase [Blastococcus sp.]|jgi:hypothetical protein|nr:family N-acetyltransferase [Blastococcus sp.]
MTHVGLRDRLLSADEALAVASWSYPAPFDLYDVRSEDPVALFTARDAPGHGYYPVQDWPEVIGFVCFGAEATTACSWS